ncbi:MAG: DUF1841 family protein [Nitrospinaceae bacterium]|nr:DUF1841 family protein [Nitrospinaceae bacterium]NIR57979.1 DUF1841 family protein [Nitrospinaceae bacterium]NIS88442.1 DUF1841 family protein [Nitrospinaceae bacterium]NIT85321.1 DUF1841 family protein [Nitrospinaceae bacterium]NIU47473.1 DUF1841 family protein [Nitrospinaceae bacterium]
MQFDKETQTRILRVAGERIGGGEIEEVDQRIAGVMDMHPEFDETWEMGEMALYPQEINGQVISPFVHTVWHVMVDKQIQDEAPEFVAETFNKLVDMGMDVHEALHAIIGVYADLYYGNFRKGDSFSNLDYEARLGLLLQNVEASSD